MINKFFGNSLYEILIFIRFLILKEVFLMQRLKIWLNCIKIIKKYSIICILFINIIDKTYTRLKMCLYIHGLHLGHHKQ